MSELESTGAAAPAADADAGAAQGPQGTEDEAWAAVLAAWADEGAHHRYLARFTDIEGLAVAGGRYKAVLDERPGDELALRMRAEVLKKATAYGLASLPRTPPGPSAQAKRLRVFVAAALGVFTAWCVYKLLVLVVQGARP